LSAGINYFVYILASKSRNLYVGVTNNIERRLVQHRNGKGGEFTKSYRVHRLVHLETFGNVRLAIAREKEVKGWLRGKKAALIESRNPTWDALGGKWSKKTEEQQ
jgi:putative endonuclease